LKVATEKLALLLLLAVFATGCGPRNKFADKALGVKSITNADAPPATDPTLPPSH
jgi:hypothetical protein